MSNAARFGALPFWAENVGRKKLSDSDFTAGVQPEFSPRLPIRIIPAGRHNSLSAATIRDVIDQTQRIITYSAYEVVNGIRPDFADLRSVDDSIVEYSTLQVQPFEEGSFVIPTVLRDEPSKIFSGGLEREFTGNQIIQRFSEVMEHVSEDTVAASIGLVQAIETLGTSLRREADRIEFYPTGPAKPGLGQMISVDRKFVKRVSEIRQQRQDPREIPDILTGTLIAVDLSKWTIKLKVDGRIVTGTFSPFMTDMLTESLLQQVKIHGVVVYRGSTPRHIRAFFSEPISD